MKNVIDNEIEKNREIEKLDKNGWKRIKSM